MRSTGQRRRRAATTLAAAGALAFPALVLAAAAHNKIPNGFYATVDETGVPGGEDVEFTLASHSSVTKLFLGCAPDAADAALIANSGYAGIGIWAPAPIALSNGSFSYSGPAKVTAAYEGAPQVDTTTLTIQGRYVRKGHVYHYAGGIAGEKVTARLVFKGTATSPACTGLPADQAFRLYHTTHTGG
jgi:hypothetical protein